MPEKPCSSARKLSIGRAAACVVRFLLASALAFALARAAGRTLPKSSATPSVAAAAASAASRPLRRTSSAFRAPEAWSWSEAVPVDRASL